MVMRAQPGTPGCVRIAIAGPDASARAALLEQLIPGLMARGAELWVQVRKRRGDALAARVRSSGLIAAERVVSVLPPGFALDGHQRLVLVDRDEPSDDEELTLGVVGADDVKRMNRSALLRPALLLLGADADAALLHAVSERREGRPVMRANLATGEGIESVLGFVANALEASRERSERLTA